MLHGDVKRLAARASQRKVHEHEPRHATVLDDIARRADDDGRNAVFFQVSGNQTHGLVADGSNRCQDRDINFFPAANFQCGRRRRLQHELLAVAAIDVVEILRDRAYTPGFDKFLQSGQG